MPIARTSPAAILAALALAFPAGALAQGAGDTQYTDPLGGDDTQAQRGGGEPQGGGRGGELRPSPPPGGEENGQENGEAQAAQRATPEGQLPATGAEPGILALLGLGLILTGTGLRIRLRQPVA